MGSEEPTSGRAVEYISSMSLQFKKSSWLYKDANGILQPEGSNKDTLTGDTEPDGMEFQIRVAKSRVCKPFGTARARLDFTKGNFDLPWELTKAAIYSGIAERAGSWFTINGERFQGQAKLRAYIEQDADLQETIKGAILNGSYSKA